MVDGSQSSPCKSTEKCRDHERLMKSLVRVCEGRGGQQGLGRSMRRGDATPIQDWQQGQKQHVYCIEMGIRNSPSAIIAWSSWCIKKSFCSQRHHQPPPSLHLPSTQNLSMGLHLHPCLLATSQAEALQLHHHGAQQSASQP